MRKHKVRVVLEVSTHKLENESNIVNDVSDCLNQAIHRKELQIHEVMKTNNQNKPYINPVIVNVVRVVSAKLVK